jgi:tetratricopeptide (TPR) repeat protein
LQLGIAAERNGDDEGALELYARAIAENPRFANAHVSLGALSFRTGHVTEAEASLLRALELDPRSTGALQALSDLYARTGRPQEAATRARALVAVAPTSAASWFLLGSAELARARAPGGIDVPARLADARAAFSKALELASNDEDRFNASFALGDVETALGAHAEALASFEQALRFKREPDAEGWFFQTHARRLAALRALGRGNEATRDAQVLLERYAADPRARALLGP